MSDIHPTAVIAPEARLAPGVRIGAYAVIGPEVSLGADTVVGPHVVIEGRTRVGQENRFVQFCSIGAAPQVSDWRGEPAELTIGDGNVFRECATVHGGAEGATTIGSRGLFMAQTHVAHDCQVGDGVQMANGATLGGHVVVEDHAWLGGLCAVHQRVRIGARAMVAGGAMVTQDAPPYCLVQGDRARLVGLNLVGLRRANVADEEVTALKQAFRELFLGAGPMAERIAALRGRESHPSVVRLTEFLRDSERGCLVTPRRPRRAFS